MTAWKFEPRPDATTTIRFAMVPLLPGFSPATLCFRADDAFDLDDAPAVHLHDHKGDPPRLDLHLLPGVLREVAEHRSIKRPPTVSYDSSMGSRRPSSSLISSTHIWASSTNTPSAIFCTSGSSRSYSSLMSPTSSSRMSSTVTMPTKLLYSSMTIAICTRWT